MKLVKRFIKHILSFEITPKIQAFDPNFKTPSISDSALRATKEIRGLDRGPAIIMHGVMPRSGTGYVGELIRLHLDLSLSDKPLSYPNDLTEIPFLGLARDLIDVQKRFFQARTTNMKRIGENDFLAIFGSAMIGYLHSFVPSDLRMTIKHPGVQYLNYFYSVFPHEDLLLLMRDGRDVVSSTIRSWPERNFADECKKWNRSAKMILKFNEHYADHDRYFLTKYEDVINDPEGFVTEACRCFGLDQKRFPFEKVEKIPVLGSSSLKRDGKVTWSPIAKPQNFKTIGHWKDWSEKQKRIFKRIAGETLINAGYCEDLNW